jgi:hypothetical protein
MNAHLRNIHNKPFDAMFPANLRMSVFRVCGNSLLRCGNMLCIFDCVSLCTVCLQVLTISSAATSNNGAYVCVVVDGAVSSAASNAYTLTVVRKFLCIHLLSFQIIWCFIFFTYMSLTDFVTLYIH